MYSEDIAKVCHEVNRAACAAFGDHSHPCFVPYDELPPEQKLKDYLFQAVVRSMV